MANAAYGELVSRLLGSFIGDQTPQKDPNWQGYDEQGNPKGSATPYQLPNWGTRFFHPDVAGAEYQGNNAAYSALLQDQIKKAIAAGTVRKVAPFVGNQFSPIADKDPTAAGVLFPNLSTEGILSGNTAAAGQDMGLGPLTAAKEAGGLVSGIRSDIEGLNTGLPENIVKAKNAQMLYEQGYYPEESKLIAPRIAYETENMKQGLRKLPSMTDADISRAVESDLAAKRSIVNAPGLDQAFASNVDTSVSEGNINKTLAAQKEKLLPLLGAIQLANIRNTLYGEQHQPAAPLTYRDPNTGKTIINQDAFNAMQEMRARLGQGSNTNTSTASIGNGKSIKLDENSSTNITPLISGSKTNTLVTPSAPANSNIKLEPTKSIPLQSQSGDLSGLDALYKPLIEQFLKRWRAGNLTQHVD